MSHETSASAESRPCPYPGCTNKVTDGTGPACSEEHKAWFNDAINNSNAGIPTAPAEKESVVSRPIGGTLDY